MDRCLTMVWPWFALASRGAAVLWQQRMLSLTEAFWSSAAELPPPPPPSPCRWWWMPCGRCGASELVSMTTSTPAPWRRGSTHWRTSSPSISLWLPACRQASSCSWPTYYGENTEAMFDQSQSPTRCCAVVGYGMLPGAGSILKLARDTIWI